MEVRMICYVLYFYLINFLHLKFLVELISNKDSD